MWILFARAPRPDATYWRGRRWLALADAVAWLSLFLWIMVASPVGGVMRIVAVTLTIVVALRRMRLALFQNGRYHFTTWRLGAYVALILAIGAMAKALLA